MGLAMQSDVSAVLDMLAQIRTGGDATMDEVMALRWDAGELEPFVQQIHHALIHFATDADIRSRDPAYDWSQRSALNKYYEELKERVGASDHK
jgi:hypothetical protein